jgi:hypothetical protein
VKVVATMKNRYKLIILSSLGLLLGPLVAYFLIFHGALSANDQSWAAFGSYLGGVVGTVFGYGSFLIVLYTYGRSEQDKDNDRKEMFFFKYLDVHRANTQTMTLLMNNNLIEGQKVLLVYKSSLVKISQEFINYKAVTEAAIAAGNKNWDYRYYISNCVEYFFTKSAIRNQMDLDLNILKYILSRMPKEDRDKYLSIQFSQITVGGHLIPRAGSW